jgi:hypothetical protein
MDSTSLTTTSVAEISRLRADKALGEFIGGPEEAQLLEVSGQALQCDLQFRRLGALPGVGYRDAASFAKATACREVPPTLGIRWRGSEVSGQMSEREK